jgi:dienelactone hydrolase
MYGNRNPDRRAARRFGACLLVVAVLFTPSAAMAQMEAPGEDVTIPGADLGDWGKVEQVAGRFGLPAGVTGQVPAVLILHGSGGVDGRGARYAKALQEAGFATLEIMMFQRSSPPGPSVNLTMPHAAAALRWLAAQRSVDAQRVGAIGFSWGAQMTVMLTSVQVRDRLGKDVSAPAAAVALYPVCTNMTRYLAWDKHPLFNAHTTMGAAPLLILVGTGDDTESEPRACDAFVATLPAAAQQRTSVRYFDGATHGFDSDRAFEYYDAMARARKGATVRVVPSEKDAAAAHAETVAFFTKYLMH